MRYRILHIVQLFILTFSIVISSAHFHLSPNYYSNTGDTLDVHHHNKYCFNQTLDCLAIHNFASSNSTIAKTSHPFALFQFVNKVTPQYNFTLKQIRYNYQLRAPPFELA